MRLKMAFQSAPAGTFDKNLLQIFANGHKVHEVNIADRDQHEVEIDIDGRLLSPGLNEVVISCIPWKSPERAAC